MFALVIALVFATMFALVFTLMFALVFFLVPAVVFALVCVLQLNVDDFTWMFVCAVSMLCANAHKCCKAIRS